MAALKREMAARAKSERELKESEERLRQMQEAMENHQRELQEARDTIARLEAQLRETQVRNTILTKHTNDFFWYWYVVISAAIFFCHLFCKKDGALEPIKLTTSVIPWFREGYLFGLSKRPSLDNTATGCYYTTIVNNNCFTMQSKQKKT